MKVRSKVRPQEIEITSDKVAIASNITPYREEFDDRIMEGYEYDCEIITKDEYLLRLAHENAELRQEILDTQLALVELYEGEM